MIPASPREWERTYVRVLVGLDGLAALCAGMTAYLVHFGDSVGGSRRWDYIALSALLPALWLGALISWKDLLRRRQR